MYLLYIYLNLIALEVVLGSAVNGHRISNFTHRRLCRTALRLHMFLNLRASEAFKRYNFQFLANAGLKTSIYF